jgi:hypothetical protein
MRHATVSGLLAAVSLIALSPAFAQETTAEDVTAQPVLETEAAPEELLETELLVEDEAALASESEMTEDATETVSSFVGLAVIDSVGKTAGTVAEVIERGPGDELVVVELDGRGPLGGKKVALNIGTMTMAEDGKSLMLPDLARSDLKKMDAFAPAAPATGPSS